MIISMKINLNTHCSWYYWKRSISLDTSRVQITRIILQVYQMISHESFSQYAKWFHSIYIFSDYTWKCILCCVKYSMHNQNRSFWITDSKPRSSVNDNIRFNQAIILALWRSSVRTCLFNKLSCIKSTSIIKNAKITYIKNYLTVLMGYLTYEEKLKSRDEWPKHMIL